MSGQVINRLHAEGISPQTLSIFKATVQYSHSPVSVLDLLPRCNKELMSALHLTALWIFDLDPACMPFVTEIVSVLSPRHDPFKVHFTGGMK
jgi:hypothetical protein